MYCSKCGAENSEDAKFCAKCGEQATGNILEGSLVSAENRVVDNVITSRNKSFSIKKYRLRVLALIAAIFVSMLAISGVGQEKKYYLGMTSSITKDEISKIGYLTDNIETNSGWVDLNSDVTQISADAQSGTLRSRSVMVPVFSCSDPQVVKGLPAVKCFSVRNAVVIIAATGIKARSDLLNLNIGKKKNLDRLFVLGTLVGLHLGDWPIIYVDAAGITEK